MTPLPNSKDYTKCITTLIEAGNNYDTVIYLGSLLRVAAEIIAHVGAINEDAGWQGLDIAEKQLRNDYCEVLSEMKKEGYRE